jgi:hypothetical protein
MPFVSQASLPGNPCAALSHQSVIEIHSLFRKLILFPFHAFW